LVLIVIKPRDLFNFIYSNHQVLRAVLENPSDDTRFSLIYAARVPEDLLLRDELDAWAEQHEQFTVRKKLRALLCFASPLFLCSTGQD